MLPDYFQIGHILHKAANTLSTTRMYYNWKLTKGNSTL